MSVIYEETAYCRSCRREVYANDWCPKCDVWVSGHDFSLGALPELRLEQIGWDGERAHSSEYVNPFFAKAVRS